MKYWIWLSTRVIRRDKLWNLCLHFNGAQNVYDASESEVVKIGELNKQEVESLRLDRKLEASQRIAEECEKKKIITITANDEVYPRNLKSIESPPILLYAKGNVNCLNDEMMFAIVGTRNASPQSLELTHKISYMLAKSGFTIVSGMAAGVDSAAACGALDAGKKTIAVFGSGVDICYPRSNEKLMNAIISNGCVLSENVPGTPPKHWTFPQRNRIIAGLSEGVLISAAPEKSGSIITATYAMEQGRDVFVVPGSPEDPEYSGSLALIKDGAVMITEVDDIIYSFGKIPVKADKSYDKVHRMRMRITSESTESPKQEKAEKSVKADVSNKTEKDTVRGSRGDPTESFKEEDRCIAKAILSGATQFDAIVEKTGIEAGQLFAKLTILEMEGKIIQKPGKYYEITI